MCFLPVGVLVSTQCTEVGAPKNDNHHLLRREEGRERKNHNIYVYKTNADIVFDLFVCDTGCPQITFGLQLLKLVFEEYLFPKDLF